MIASRKAQMTTARVAPQEYNQMLRAQSPECESSFVDASSWTGAYGGGTATRTADHNLAVANVCRRVPEVRVLVPSA